MQTTAPVQTLYEKDYALTFSHIDNRGLSRPSALFDFMQDIATLHASQVQLDPAHLHAVWVLSRIRATLRRPLRAYEQLHLSTWCAGIQGATWCRRFSFSCGDEPLGEATSSWVVLDPSTRRIVRPSAIPQASAYLRVSDGALTPLPKLSCDTLTLHHSHPVCYSDLDVNNHLNNVKLVDLATDGLDLNLQDGLFVSSLQVNYTRETHFGERLDILTGEQDGTHFVVGQVDGTEHFTAAAVYSPY